MRSSALVINCGWEQAPLIDHLAEREDYILYGVHFDDAPHRQDAFADIMSCEMRDTRALMSFSDRVGPDAVLADQCDSSLFYQALIARRHGLPGPSVQSAQFSNNKYLQRRRAAEQNVRIPAFNLCLTDVDITAFADRHGYPVIVKPVDNRGSFGVVKVEGPAQVSDAFAEALSYSAARLVIVEAFIEGVHVTVDGYAFKKHGPKSMALATKQLVNEKTQVSTGITYPGALPENDFSRLMAENERVNLALGYDFGMLHSEYMVQDGEFFLVESTNRGGGVFTSEIIVPESSGNDLLRQYVADCLGESLDVFSPPQHAPIVLRFFNFEPGRIAGIEGWEKIKNHRNVLASRIFVNVGDIIKPITTDANRHGFFILRGCPADADKLLETVKVHYA